MERDLFGANIYNNTGNQAASLRLVVKTTNTGLNQFNTKHIMGYKYCIGGQNLAKDPQHPLNFQPLHSPYGAKDIHSCYLCDDVPKKYEDEFASVPNDSIKLLCRNRITSSIQKIWREEHNNHLRQPQIFSIHCMRE